YRVFHERKMFRLSQGSVEFPLPMQLDNRLINGIELGNQFFRHPMMRMFRHGLFPPLNRVMGMVSSCMSVTTSDKHIRFAFHFICSAAHGSGLPRDERLSPAGSRRSGSPGLEP